MPTTVPQPQLFEPESIEAPEPIETGEGTEPIHYDALAPSEASFLPRTSGAYLAFGQRLFDLVLIVLVTLPTLALALPIALVNLAIFRDPRRILFLQLRVGKNGHPFRILKFRTMYETKDAFGSWGAGEDRLRVTRFGRFLRNTHLDELPQLVNVLRGQMSIVGPRPEMIEVDAWAREHVPSFNERNRVRPGITGMAQVTQGYASMCTASYARKLELDRSYCRAISFSLDLRILIRTFFWMARGKGWSYHVTKAAEAAGPDREKPEDSAPVSRAA